MTIQSLSCFIATNKIVIIAQVSLIYLHRTNSPTLNDSQGIFTTSYMIVFVTSWPPL